MSEEPERGRSAGERLAVFIAFGLLAWATYRVVQPLLGALLLAAALTTLIRGFYRLVERRLHGRRRLAAVLTELALFVCVLAPLAALGTYLVRHLITEVTQLVTDLRAGSGTVERLVAHLGPLADPVRQFIDELRPRLTEAAPELTQKFARFATSLGSTLAHIGIGLFILVLALYYFLVDGAVWWQRIERLVPLPADEVRLFGERFHQVSVAVLAGNLGTALAQGAVGTVGYLIFGAPLPLVWGMVTAFAALIPGIGTILVWAPLSVAVGVSRGWFWGVGLALYGVLVVATVDNVVRPLLTRRGLAIHPLAIFVAVFGGVASLGLVGLFLGPLVVALAITALDVYERHLKR